MCHPEELEPQQESCSCRYQPPLSSQSSPRTLREVGVLPLDSPGWYPDLMSRKFCQQNSFLVQELPFCPPNCYRKAEKRGKFQKQLRNSGFLWESQNIPEGHPWVCLLLPWQCISISFPWLVSSKSEEFPAATIPHVCTETWHRCSRASQWELLRMGTTPALAPLLMLRHRTPNHSELKYAANNSTVPTGVAQLKSTHNQSRSSTVTCNTP